MIKKKISKYIAFILAISFILACFLLTGCEKKDTADNNKIRFSKVSDFNGITVCSQTGTVFDDILNGSISDLNHKYYDDISGMILALRNNYVDAIALDEPVARFVTAQNKDFEIFKEAIETDSYGFSMAKNGPLTDDVSKIIQQFYEDGTIDKLKEKWFSGDTEKMKINKDEYTGYDTSNGVLRFVHDSTQIPMAYVDDNGNSSGYEVELLLMIGKKLKRKVEMSQANFSSLITAVSSGKADIAAGSISITDERKESVDFPESHYIGGIVLVCHKSDVSIVTNQEEKIGFIEGTKDSFEKTVIRENRWRLILSGLAITLIISLCSLVIGTLLGLLVCALRRNNNKVVAKIMAILIRFVQGIPVVVLLMVFYYIVFAKSEINAVIVAIIGFSVNFGVNSAEIFRSGMDAIGKEQWEVAFCLGLNNTQTFAKVILPQTILNCFPAYKVEFINMMKMTSVVGYIAIQDLTKVLDIIRSRTYEAIFPLILNALIYILLAWLLTRLMELIEFKISPKKRARRLRGQFSLKDAKTFSKQQNLEDLGTELIRIEHLKKAYKEAHYILSDVNAQINKGDVVSIIGPSGSGKTTFLRVLAQLEKPSGGHIYINGQDIGGSKGQENVKQKIGMVSQNFDLFPHLTVIENIMLAPMMVLKASKEDAFVTAVELLKSVGLAEKVLHYPNELSGGQKQRVAIARTLAMRPEIILLDEPTSALDPTAVSEILNVISNLAKQGYTMVIITHEMQFAKDVSTRVFYIDEGQIYETGSPEQIFNVPQKEKTRKFIHKLKVFEENIISRNFDFIAVSAKIDSFGQKYRIDPKTVKNMQVIFEELVVGIIIPSLPDKIDINIISEYSQLNDTTNMSICYNGERLDPTSDADELLMTLVRNSAKDIYYGYHPDDELKNEIKLTVK